MLIGTRFCVWLIKWDRKMIGMFGAWEIIGNGVKNGDRIKKTDILYIIHTRIPLLIMWKWMWLKCEVGNQMGTMYCGGKEQIIIEKK